ncbi:MAG: PTS sugar transporter subunit IIA, partial [Acidobacteria bacterium]|nr:PTS sugar transporter subunit IIA [Acidobacteriota bacterium]
ELIFPDIKGSDGDGVLRELAERLAALGHVRKAEVLFQRLREREELGSTALGRGVAVPHCRLQGLSELLVAIGVCRDGIDFAAEDGEPVRVFFLVVSPNNAAAEHLHCLAAISKWVKNGRLPRLLELEEPDEIYRWIDDSND